MITVTPRATRYSAARANERGLDASSRSAEDASRMRPPVFGRVTAVLLLVSGPAERRQVGGRGSDIDVIRCILTRVSSAHGRDLAAAGEAPDVAGAFPRSAHGTIAKLHTSPPGTSGPFRREDAPGTVTSTR